MEVQMTITYAGVSSLGTADSTMSSPRLSYQNLSVATEVKSWIDAATATKQTAEQAMYDVAHWAFFAL